MNPFDVRGLLFCFNKKILYYMLPTCIIANLQQYNAKICYTTAIQMHIHVYK
jgi:hypothetical protein